MAITIFERGPYISFANCGLPYHVGNDIKSRDALILQTPASFKARFNVDVRVNSEVTAINREAKTVTVLDTLQKTEYTEPYDMLVYSPGASPIVPPIPGLKELLGKRVFTLRNIPDMDGIISAMGPAAQMKRCLVVGGGFIGLEVAEALVHVGWEAVIVEKAPQVMGTVDAEMASYLHDELAAKGVKLQLGKGASAFSEAGAVLRVALDDGSSIDADFAVLCIGVRPDVGLAKAAGIELGPLGGIKVDAYMRTNDPSIYAVGDAVETPSTVSPSHTMLPCLAGPANRQGRAAASNLLGKELAYTTSQATAICQVFDVNIGSVGANERLLQRWGYTPDSYETVFLHAPNHAGYYPGATLLHMKLIFGKKDGKILGAQIAGKEGVDKRIDVLAVAQRAGMTVYDLQDLELCYAPPFNGAKDIVNQAGFLAANILNGDVEVCRSKDMQNVTDKQLILDVRKQAEVDEGRIPHAVHIPVDELRARIAEVPKDKEILVYCKSGMRAHVAAMMLRHHGHKVRNLTGGYLSWKAETATSNL
eukprot:TRINITY_DN2241_c1_g4_i1.p1 TRINITY_DN2241_c1_g4~~TRINITY_DN2241_c1_g4_i1.p1  ORF type:complete len:575 (+),score=223.82 TRINITY_DN2241_c1_g4_i1:125-1726(+)